MYRNKNVPQIKSLRISLYIPVPNFRAIGITIKNFSLNEHGPAVVHTLCLSSWRYNNIVESCT